MDCEFELKFLFIVDYFLKINYNFYLLLNKNLIKKIYNLIKIKLICQIKYEETGN